MRLRLLVAVIASVATLATPGCASRATASQTAQDSLRASQLAFVRFVSHILILSSDGGTHLVASGEGIEEPKWSPDHKNIAYLLPEFSLDPPGSEVWLVNSDGTNNHRITLDYPRQVRSVAFGGKQPLIAYSDSLGIWIMNPDGTGAKLILGVPDAVDLTISGDGSTIAYVDSTSSSPDSLRTIGTSPSTPLTVFPGTNHTCSVRSPTWSPDGRWIAFSLCTDKGGLNEELGVWLVRPDGKELHRIITDGYQPTWSPDGKWIAFNTSGSDSRGNVTGGFFAVRPDGTGRTRLTQVTDINGSSADDQPNW